MTDTNALVSQIDSIRKALVNPASLTQQTVNEIGAQLGMLYQAAEEVRNQHALAIIQTTWDLTQAVAEQVTSLHHSAISAADLAQEIALQRNEAVCQLAELESAIKQIDTENPLISTLVQEVEMSLEEEIEERQWEYASESAHDEAYNQLSEGIEEALGLAWSDHWHFLDALRAEENFTDDERDELKAIIVRVHARIAKHYRQRLEEHNRRVAEIRKGQ
jgi:Ni,Fe-hydrogenase I large subunit